MESARLGAYLERIGLSGPIAPDVRTLREMHRAHQLAVPFENLDIQLRRPVTVDVMAAYDKIVNRRRGGWCYEMNGVMGWALQQIGFEVTRMSGGVMREQLGDVQMGNHLCLLVQLEQPYLVDVGFGGSLIEPLPLRSSAREDQPYQLALTETVDGHWRYSETGQGAPFTFDFGTAPASDTLLAQKCRYLQTEPSSPFIQNLVVQRRSIDTHLSLRGRVLTTLRPSSEDKVLINSPEELVAVLLSRFDLDVPEVATLWPAICARHEGLYGVRAARN